MRVWWFIWLIIFFPSLWKMWRWLWKEVSKIVWWVWGDQCVYEYYLAYYFISDSRFVINLTKVSLSLTLKDLKLSKNRIRSSTQFHFFRMVFFWQLPGFNPRSGVSIADIVDVNLHSLFLSLLLPFSFYLFLFLDLFLPELWMLFLSFVSKWLLGLWVSLCTLKWCCNNELYQN